MTAKTGSHNDLTDFRSGLAQDQPKLAGAHAIKGIFLLIACAWTVLVAGLAILNYQHFSTAALEIALASARDTFSRDLVYRRWATTHGGVYVPISPDTPPNPYLAHIPERDIRTPSGKMLTLVNPAYMTRQVLELGFKQYGLRGHITSLKPIRPENAPDEWERTTLQAFERGEKEVASLEPIGNKIYFRFMRPMITEKGCMKCHAGQGYAIGDIRGGISVSVPWEASQLGLRAHLRTTLLAFGLIWLVGLAGAQVARHRLLMDLTVRKRIEEEINRQLAEKGILLKEVHHRIKNNIASIGGLLSLQQQSITNPEAAAVLQDAIGRVDSMRILYDKLLLTESYKDISVKNYIESLVDTVVALFPDCAKVKIDKYIFDFQLEPKRLFPLGIIINELLTNTMKYAFTNRDSGVIKISLTHVDNHATLTIQDNGYGLPDGFDVNESKGFGLMLVKMLSQQLGGSFSMEKRAGTLCKVEFTI
jgi:two-component sensor histidine kinase